MACALEARAPFLDYTFVEFVNAIPVHLKLKGLKSKYILKKAMQHKLPPEILGRRKKGFGIPVGQWFRHDLRDLMLDVLSESRLRRQGIFNPAEVTRLVDEHLSGTVDNRKKLWTLFIFQLWHEHYLALPRGSGPVTSGHPPKKTCEKPGTNPKSHAEPTLTRCGQSGQINPIDIMASSERFGYEWDKYCRMTADYEDQFRNWVHPLSEADFKGRRILDAGCGMGRNSYWPLKWGAHDVTAFDLDSRTVDRARETLKPFSNVVIVQKSIYEMDWEEQFDIAMSIGVIHHLEDPQKALRLMVQSLKPGGTILTWVYSREGNEWIVRYVNPVRKHITSRLPVSLVHVMSYFCSVPLWLFVKLFRGPTRYLRQLSSFDLWHVHSIVFDQLIPGVANYWSKEQVSSLFKNVGLKKCDIYRPPNEMGWTVVGRK